MTTNASSPTGGTEPVTPSCELCFLIARVRSGTTVLKRMLATHPNFVNAGELFNEDNPLSYWYFLEDKLKNDPQAAFPSRSERNFLEYLCHLETKLVGSRDQAAILLLDVKYDHAHSISLPWYDMNALPLIFFMIRRFRWKVIDIHRRNLISLFVSNQIAWQTKVYHRDPSGEAHLAKVQIQIEHLVKDMLSTCRSYQRLREHFFGYNNYLQLLYEDMFCPDGQFTETLSRQLCTFFGVQDLFNRTPKLRKLLSDDVFFHIKNVDEVRIAMQRLQLPQNLDHDLLKK
jgi:LPS sulfotransferase NodH